MGLDLTLYAVPAANDINPDDAVDKWIELAYGRKTWFIWDYFKNLDTTIMIKDDQILTIPKEAWESFIGVLDRNRERISSYSAFNVDNLSAEELAKAQIKEALFQEWYNDTFNITPTLGYQHDAWAMLQWLNADQAVRNILDDPNYIVILEASY